jgi:hypothetical protein
MSNGMIMMFSNGSNGRILETLERFESSHPYTEYISY